MPRYYCDYCDTFLTHDSPSVRKQHNAGYKHKANVRNYFMQFEETQTQAMLDAKMREYEARTAANLAILNPPPIPIIRPGMIPPPGMARPPMMGGPGMPPPGMPPHGMSHMGPPPGGFHPPGHMHMGPPPPGMMMRPPPGMMGPPGGMPPHGHMGGPPHGHGPSH